MLLMVILLILIFTAFLLPLSLFVPAARLKSSHLSYYFFYLCSTSFHYFFRSLYHSCSCCSSFFFISLLYHNRLRLLHHGKKTLILANFIPLPVLFAMLPLLLLLFLMYFCFRHVSPSTSARISWPKFPLFLVLTFHFVSPPLPFMAALLLPDFHSSPFLPPPSSVTPRGIQPHLKAINTTFLFLPPPLLPSLPSSVLPFAFPAFPRHSA